MNLPTVQPLHCCQMNENVDRTAPLYLCELIEQQKSSTITRPENDAFLLKLPPHPVEIVPTPFLSVRLFVFVLWVCSI